MHKAEKQPLNPSTAQSEHEPLVFGTRLTRESLQGTESPLTFAILKSERILENCVITRNAVKFPSRQNVAGRHEEPGKRHRMG